MEDTTAAIYFFLYQKRENFRNRLTTKCSQSENGYVETRSHFLRRYSFCVTIDADSAACVARFVEGRI